MNLLSLWKETWLLRERMHPPPLQIIFWYVSRIPANKAPSRPHSTASAEIIQGKRCQTLWNISEFTYFNGLLWLLLTVAMLTRSLALTLSRWRSGKQSPLWNERPVHPKKSKRARLHCGAVWFITQGSCYIYLWEPHEGVKHLSPMCRRQVLHFVGPCHLGCRFITCKVEVIRKSCDIRSLYILH